MNRFHPPHPDGTSRLSVPLSINNASNLFPFHNLFIQLLSPSDGTRGLCFSLHNASPLFCGNILFLPNIKIGCLSTLSPHNEIALNPPNECNRPEIALNITLRARAFSEIFSFHSMEASPRSFEAIQRRIDRSGIFGSICRGGFS